MRIVFFGTPDFAVPSLEALIAAGHEVVGVLTQPDKPVGRHQNKLQPPPVKVCAQKHGIPVWQPTKMRDGTVLQLLQQLQPELVAVAAYGRILPDDVLAVPPLGCINVHSSLLPKYRGAAPIHWSVMNGDAESGVTIMHMAHDLDAGDIILQRSTPIDIEESVETLHDRLAEIGGGLLVEAVAMLKEGTASRTPQDPEQVTYAPMLSRDLSPIDWTRTARQIHDQIRGLCPWPAASSDVIQGTQLKFYRSTLPGTRTDAAPGTVVSATKAGIDIACGDGCAVRILELQEAGKKRMAAGAWLAGHRIQTK